VAAEDAMHHDAQFVFFKVNTIVADAEAMENASGAFNNGGDYFKRRTNHRSMIAHDNDYI